MASIKPSRKLPEPPELVQEDPDALEEWKRMLASMAPAGLAKPLDRGLLAGCCLAYARWYRAEKALAMMARKDPQTNGVIIRTSNGNHIQNPLVGAANKALMIYERIAMRFGVSPVGRAMLDLSAVELMDEATEDEEIARRFFGD
ncbi:P27 family phage terminase small subunit [Paraburkholderia sp. BR13444]|uniref:P27 family phage terminase small subunit n=1 Tax=Paraburkholderia sp. BR13444 TaxID=3236997 RepID=UPI0034CDE6FE